MASTEATTSKGGELVATLHAGWPRRLLVPLAWAAAGVAATAVAHGARADALERWTIGVPAVLGLLATLELWRRRAVVTREALSVRWMLGTGRVRFASLQSFTYDARSFRLYLFLPFGRLARLRLVGEEGRATFHAGLARFDAYLPIVLDLAVAATVARMRRDLDRGEKASFGRRLSVDPTGVTVKGRLFGEKRVSVEELQVRVEDGEFHLTTPQEELGSFPLRSTPNLLALPQLLEELSVTRGRPRPAALQDALAWRR